MGHVKELEFYPEVSEVPRRISGRAVVTHQTFSVKSKVVNILGFIGKATIDM